MVPGIKLCLLCLMLWEKQTKTLFAQLTANRQKQNNNSAYSHHSKQSCLIFGCIFLSLAHAYFTLLIDNFSNEPVIAPWRCSKDMHACSCQCPNTDSLSLQVHVRRACAQRLLRLYGCHALVTAISKETFYSDRNVLYLPVQSLVTSTLNALNVASAA